MYDHYQIEDDRFVDDIILEVKSQGEFDKFRKEFIADVDTKPAYQNLRQRVEESVSGYLDKQRWRPELNKNQLRERLRKHIQEANYLEIGVERIVDQVIDPKLNSLHSKVEEIVYRYLGVDKPVKQETNGTLAVETNHTENDLELEAVSPDSDKKSSNLSSVSNQENGMVEEYMEVDQETMLEEYESPAFEPLEGLEKKTNENSQHSNLSEISGLTSQDSVDNKSQKSEKSTKSIKSEKSEKSPPAKPRNLLEDSQMSQVSSSSAFNINEEAQMPKFPENSSEEPTDPQTAPIHNFDLNRESIEFTGTERKSLALEEVSDESKDLLADKVHLDIDHLYENETTTDSSELRMEIDLKDDTRSNDVKVQKIEDFSQTSHHSHHSASNSGTTESEKLDKSDKLEKSEKSDKDPKKDDRKGKESSSRSDKSKYHKSSSSSSKYHHSSTSKSDRHSSSRSKDRPRDDRKDHKDHRDGKDSKDKYRRSTSDKNKSRSSHKEREDRVKDSKESSQDSKHSKEEKEQETKDSKEKDDHYSAKEKPRKRRSTDHDSSGGDVKKPEGKIDEAPPLPPAESIEVAEAPPAPPTPPSNDINDKIESNQPFIMLDQILTEMETPATTSKDLEKTGRIIKKTVFDQGVELQIISSNEPEEPKEPKGDISETSLDCFGFPEVNEVFPVDPLYNYVVLSHNMEAVVVLPKMLKFPFTNFTSTITSEDSHSNSGSNQSTPNSSNVQASGKRIRKPNNNFIKDYYCNGEEIEVIDMKKIKYGDQVKTVNHRMSTAEEEISLELSLETMKVEDSVKVVDVSDSQNTKNHIADNINNLLNKSTISATQQRYPSGELYKPRLYGSRNRQRTSWREKSVENPSTEAEVVEPINKVEEKTVAV